MGNGGSSGTRDSGGSLKRVLYKSAIIVLQYK